MKRRESGDSSTGCVLSWDSVPHVGAYRWCRNLDLGMSSLGTHMLYHKWQKRFKNRKLNKGMEGIFCQKSHGRFETRIAICPFPVQSPRSLSSNKFALFADICISLSYVKIQNVTAVTSCSRKASCSNEVGSFLILWIFPSVCFVQYTWF